MSVIVLDQKWLNANKNSKADQAILDRATDYAGKSSGAYRVLQTMGKGLRLGMEGAKKLGYLIPKAVEAAHSKIVIGGDALGFPRLFSTTSSAVQAIGTLQKSDDGVSFARKAAKAVRDVMDMVACYGFCAIFLKYNPAVSAVAQTADLATDAIDLHISTTDYLKSSELEEKASGEVKKVLTHTRKYQMLRVIKATVSVAAAIFSFALVFYFGLTLLPILALAALSLTSTLLAIARDNFKDTGAYSVLDLDREVHLA